MTFINLKTKEIHDHIQKDSVVYLENRLLKTDDKLYELAVYKSTGREYITYETLDEVIEATEQFIKDGFRYDSIMIVEKNKNGLENDDLVYSCE